MLRKLLNNPEGFAEALRGGHAPDWFEAQHRHWSTYVLNDTARPDATLSTLTTLPLLFHSPASIARYSEQIKWLFWDIQSRKMAFSVLTLTRCKEEHFFKFARTLYASKYPTVTDEKIEELRVYLKTMVRPDKIGMLNDLYVNMFKALLAVYPWDTSATMLSRREEAQKILGQLSLSEVGPLFRVSSAIHRYVARWMRDVLWPALYVQGTVVTPAPLADAPYVDAILWTAFSTLTFLENGSVDLYNTRDTIMDREGKLYHPVLLALLLCTRPLEEIKHRTICDRLDSAMHIFSWPAGAIIPGNTLELLGHNVRDFTREVSSLMQRVMPTILHPIWILREFYLPDRANDIVEQLLLDRGRCNAHLRFWKYVSLVKDHARRWVEDLTVNDMPFNQSVGWVVPGTRLVFEDEHVAYTIVSLLRPLIDAIPDAGESLATFLQLLQVKRPPLLKRPAHDTTLVRREPAPTADYVRHFL